MNRRVILIGAALALSLPGAFAAGPRDPRRAIEAANAEFGAAYGRGDARAVAAMYYPGKQDDHTLYTSSVLDMRMLEVIPNALREVEQLTHELLHARP